MKEEIIKLYNEGKSYSEIVNIIGCAKSTVSYYLKNIRLFSQDELKIKIIVNCNHCGKEILRRPSKIHNTNFCSTSHKSLYHNNTNIGKEILSLAGLKSAKNRVTRSKNEIYFSELCKEKFTNVTINDNIFNGWDADVIIHDIKVAVLWNGKWHYEKVTMAHSVKQVQNRDNIKIKEIENKGYLPFIIKDMGKFNKKFVENKFIEFLQLMIIH